MLSFKKGIILLIANVVKSLCYVFHFFFPKKRFIIPPISKALKHSKHDHKIPKIIWQTNYTDKVTLPVYLNYLFNRFISPTYEHHFVSTESRLKFVKENYSKEIFDSYSKIQIGAAQADFWRVLVLHKLGGVYMDIDATLVTSLDNLIKKDDSIIFLKVKGNKICNSFLAAKCNTPELDKVIKQIMQNIKENTINNVFEMTGPGVYRKLFDVTKFKTFHYKTTFQGGFTNEYFQYIDKIEGKWHRQQKTTPIIKQD